MPNAVIAQAWIAASLIALGIAAPAASAATADPYRETILIGREGSVICPTNRPAPAPARSYELPPRRYAFGLPATLPTRRGWEDERLPIGRTQWETNGVRYTQIVLVTRREAGDLMPEGKVTLDSVLLVQVVGENLASEYREATAAFSVEAGGRAREIESRDDRVCDVGEPDAQPLAVVDITPAGIALSRGGVLRFRGHMPPGASGAMTVKIPLSPLPGDDALKRLRDLDFEEEFRRVKRYWTDRIKAGQRDGFPLAFAPDDFESRRRGP